MPSAITRISAREAALGEGASRPAPAAGGVRRVYVRRQSSLSDGRRRILAWAVGRYLQEADYRSGVRPVVIDVLA